MITDFPLKSLYNPGGLRNFKFIPALLVKTYPFISSSQVLEALTFLPEVDWLNGYSTPDTLLFDEDSESSENGPMYKQEVSGFAPGDKLALIDLMNDMEGQSFVIRTTDYSGQLRLIGSHGTPLTFSAKYTSGSGRSNSKGYQFKFTGYTNFRAPAYNV